MRYLTGQKLVITGMLACLGPGCQQRTDHGSKRSSESSVAHAEGDPVKRGEKADAQYSREQAAFNTLLTEYRNLLKLPPITASADLDHQTADDFLAGPATDDSEQDFKRTSAQYVLSSTPLLRKAITQSKVARILPLQKLVLVQIKDHVRGDTVRFYTHELVLSLPLTVNRQVFQSIALLASQFSTDGPIESALNKEFGMYVLRVRNSGLRTASRANLRLSDSQPKTEDFLDDYRLILAEIRPPASLQFRPHQRSDDFLTARAATDAEEDFAETVSQYMRSSIHVWLTAIHHWNQTACTTPLHFLCAVQTAYVSGNELYFYTPGFVYRFPLGVDREVFRNIVALAVQNANEDELQQFIEHTYPNYRWKQRHDNLK